MTEHANHIPKTAIELKLAADDLDASLRQFVKALSALDVDGPSYLEDAKMAMSGDFELLTRDPSFWLGYGHRLMGEVSTNFLFFTEVGGKGACKSVLILCAMNAVDAAVALQIFGNHPFFLDMVDKEFNAELKRGAS